ncbi:unnamed protein product [Urochloa humidicola]
MQANKEENTAAAPPAAAGKPPSICDRFQRAFQARPAFRPLRRLAVRHQDGDGADKPADAGAVPGPAPKHRGPPVPVPPRLPTPSPVPVRLPAVTEKASGATAPLGPPVPVPPPDVTAGMAQQAKTKTRVGSRVREALSSK